MEPAVLHMVDRYLYSIITFLSSSPHSDVEVGDLVVAGQCRPLSKTVRFNVLKVQKVKGGKKQFQKF